MKRTADMKAAGRSVEQAIRELRPAIHASCPNELAMRSAMALIRLSNAFTDAGLGPLQMMIPCEPEPSRSDEMKGGA
jgi:hypothetical protein